MYIESSDPDEIRQKKNHGLTHCMSVTDKRTDGQNYINISYGAGANHSSQYNFEFI